VYLPFGVGVCTLPRQAFMMAGLKVASARAVQVPAQPVTRHSCCPGSSSACRSAYMHLPMLRFIMETKHIVGLLLKNMEPRA
jgi:hypothetical protein